MVIKIEGLPDGYLLMKAPDNNETYLLALEIEGEQKLREIKYFDSLPDLDTCLKAITDWDVAE